MSTNALIAYKNENGNYDLNSIHFDGYIEGVGKTLQEYWNIKDEAEDLCHENEIRCLGNFDETEFYNTNTFSKRRNITFDDLCNLAGNFDFTYVYENNEWKLLKNNKHLVSY